MQTALATTTRALQHRSQLEAHLRGLLVAQLSRLHKNWRFRQSASPVDAVHDLRVATRRLRAFCDVIEHALGNKAATRFGRRIKRITRVLGELRNIDVLIEMVEQRLSKARSDRDRAALEHLLEIFVEERNRAERKAHKRLGEVDEAALCAHIRAAFDEAMRSGPETGVSLEVFARHLVARRAADAIERAPQREDVEDVDQLHRLRIAVKKLRYAVELFAPALDARSTKLHERALALQDLLGEHQDLVVLGDHVERSLKGLHERKRRALGAGLAKLATSLRAERSRLVARYAPEDLKS